MRLVLVVLAGVMAGCAGRRIPAPAAPIVSGPSYVDLQTGWRVRVVTPVLKSGGFVLKPSEEKEEGNTITIRVGDEFQGYETVTYAVEERKGGGVRAVLREVDLNRGGVPERFVNKPFKSHPVPAEVWINQPTPKDKNTP